MGAIVEVTGLRQVQAKLSELEAKIRPGLLATTRPGAKLLVAAIRAEAPVGPKARPAQNDMPGNLAASVQFKTSRTKSTGFTGHVVAPYGKGSAHRYLVIAGHQLRGHSTFARVGVGRLVRVRRGALTGGTTTPNPFVQRGRERAEALALAATEEAALRVVQKALGL